MCLLKCNFRNETSEFPDDMPRMDIFRVLVRVLGMKAKRKRTRKYNLTETVDLIKNSKKILILTGAGISVSCGIPDFRSRNGLYAKLAVDFPELPDPQVFTRSIISFNHSFLEHVLFEILQVRSSSIFPVCQGNISWEFCPVAITQLHCPAREK